MPTVTGIGGSWPRNAELSSLLDLCFVLKEKRRERRGERGEGRGEGRGEERGEKREEIHEERGERRKERGERRAARMTPDQSCLIGVARGLLSCDVCVTCPRSGSRTHHVWVSGLYDSVFSKRKLVRTP